MLPLGHLGIGYKVAGPWSKGLPVKPLLLGTLLPDLIDKPLYVLAVAITGRQGGELGLVCGTRTFGHTLLLFVLVWVAGLMTKSGKKSKILAALALGMATHLFLDTLSDTWIDAANDHLKHLMPQADGLLALFWPLRGWRFPVYPLPGLREHFASRLNPVMIGAEGLGLLLLVWEYWKSRHKAYL